MLKMIVSTLFVCIATLSANAAVEETTAATIKVAEHPQLGKILTDSKGMTLYMFMPDKSSASACYDQCAITWPPLLTSAPPTLATGVEGSLEIKARRDNKQQVTYNEMPLYYYVKDKKPGDAYGQNVDGKWFVIKIK